MSDLHSWFHIRFIKGGIQEVLSGIEDDDERESFFLIVLEKVTNQGLTGPTSLCAGDRFPVFSMPRACMDKPCPHGAHKTVRTEGNAAEIDQVNDTGQGASPVNRGRAMDRTRGERNWQQQLRHRARSMEESCWTVRSGVKEEAGTS